MHQKSTIIFLGDIHLRKMNSETGVKLCNNTYVLCMYRVYLSYREHNKKHVKQHSLRNVGVETLI